ncbi:hypothetical protein ACU4GG_19835 [Streptomyces nojiriensis]
MGDDRGDVPPEVGDRLQRAAVFAVVLAGGVRHAERVRVDDSLEPDRTGRLLAADLVQEPAGVAVLHPCHLGVGVVHEAGQHVAAAQPEQGAALLGPDPPDVLPHLVDHVVEDMYGQHGIGTFRSGWAATACG